MLWINLPTDRPAALSVRLFSLVLACFWSVTSGTWLGFWLRILRALQKSSNIDGGRGRGS